MANNDEEWEREFKEMLENLEPAEPVKNKKIKNAPMNNDDIVNEVVQRLQAFDQPVPAPAPKDSKFNISWDVLKVALMLTIVISLGGIVFWAMTRQVRTVAVPTTTTPQRSVSQPIKTAGTSADLEQKLKNAYEKIDILEERINSHEHKLQTVGIAFDENMYILRNHIPTNQIIYIDENWGLSAPPKYIKLNSEAQKFTEGLRGGNSHLYELSDEIEVIPAN